MYAPPAFSFADMLGDDFDTKLLDQTIGVNNTDDCVPLPFFQQPSQSDIGTFQTFIKKEITTPNYRNNFRTNKDTTSNKYKHK